MDYVVVTVETTPQESVDLALPLGVSTQTLAEAIARVIGRVQSEGSIYLLALKTAEGMIRLSPNATLADVSVLEGSILRVESIAQQVKGAVNAWLEAESGQAFALDTDTILIGRRDPKRGILVDVDLTPLDRERVVTRRHAGIEKQGTDYLLTDLGSINGTFLNGERLQPHVPHPLRDGDALRFGRKGVLMTFRCR